MPESNPPRRPDATEQLRAILRERILVLDGAMGTLIQGHQPGEEESAGSGSPTGRATSRATATCSTSPSRR